MKFSANQLAFHYCLAFSAVLNYFWRHERIFSSVIFGLACFRVTSSVGLHTRGLHSWYNPGSRLFLLHCCFAFFLVFFLASGAPILWTAVHIKTWFVILARDHNLLDSIFYWQTPCKDRPIRRVFSTTLFIAFLSFLVFYYATHFACISPLSKLISIETATPWQWTNVDRNWT